VTAEWMLWGT